MKWTAVPSATPPYLTIAEDTHYGVWQRDPARGFFDEKLLGLILPHVPKGCVAIDGGAFNGEYAIAFARKAKHVYAYEPQRALFLGLAANLFLGRHENVTPINEALGDECDLIGMEEVTGEGNLGGLRISRVGKGTIEMNSLDAQDFGGPVGFIKLDIEGWEGRTLRGAEEILRIDRPNLWIEMNAPRLAEHGDTPEDLIAWLDDLGYTVTAGTGAIGVPQWDALCLPR